MKKSNRDKIGNWKKLSRGVSKKVQHTGGPRRSTSESLGVRQEDVERQNQDQQPDRNMDHPSHDVRVTKRKAEDEGEHE